MKWPHPFLSISSAMLWIAGLLVLQDIAVRATTFWHHLGAAAVMVVISGLIAHGITMEDR